MKGKIRHCWYCGEDMGFIEDRYFDKHDTCGKAECERERRYALREEREEAQRRLDENMGWDFDRW
jgi:anaerobic ribonucleoside-triphosphate reductase